MTRASIFLSLIVLAASSCVGIQLVPKEQAARDLGCPIDHVQVQSDSTPPPHLGDARTYKGGTAFGCNKAATYFRICEKLSDGKEHCRFAAYGGATVSGVLPGR
jgi:hypothetical protein